MNHATCLACGQSAVHRSDSLAWDDIYHLAECSAQEMDLPEAESNGLAELSYAVPQAA